MRLLHFFLLCFSVIHIQAQPGKIIAGPMLGHVEQRTAKVWVEVTPGTQAGLWYWKKGDFGNKKYVVPIKPLTNWFLPLTFEIVGLDYNTAYEYKISLNAKSTVTAKPDGTFTTTDIWAFRKPAPDITFLAGSCAYFNEAAYDRPGNPYGGDTSIFTTMANENAGFMIWMGDNWYTREGDYGSPWGLYYRAHRDRSLRFLQPLLKNMSHYATWDDHDFGPNDMGAAYIYSAESRDVFRSYWANPTYGKDNSGVYTKMMKSDVDFFLMDDRTFRDADHLKDSVGGKPNPDKKMWGAVQMQWLKNQLKMSPASFKIIVNGSQVLNPASPFDCLWHYPVEFRELMDFLKQESIRGVLFMSGDRHHSEIIKYEQPDFYTLYDITSSPLSAGVAKAAGVEKDNAARVEGTLVEQASYARFRVSGKQGARLLAVEFLDVKGNKISSWSVMQGELIKRQ
jgi:alkaline phosphatase D